MPSGQSICLSVSDCLPETWFIGAGEGGVHAVREKVRLGLCLPHPRGLGSCRAHRIGLHRAPSPAPSVGHVDDVS